MGLKKIIPSSESYLLNDESEELLIPNLEDPVRNISKNYWKMKDGTMIKEKMPLYSQKNKIYLNEDKDFYTTNSYIREFVKIFRCEKEPINYQGTTAYVQKVNLMMV